MFPMRSFDHGLSQKKPRPMDNGPMNTCNEPLQSMRDDCHSFLAPKRSLSRYFAVGPVRSLGDDLDRAVIQLGGDPRERFRAAQGFIVVDGIRYQRLTGNVSREQALTLGKNAKLSIGKAVGFFGEQVIYEKLEVPRAPIEKALDVLSPQGFLRAVYRISRALRSVTRGAEADAVRRAIERLDVDWPNLSPEAQAQVVRAANQALSDLPEIVLPQVDQIFSVEAKRVVLGTRASARRTFGLRIGTDLSKTDERIARYVHESQTNFIRDELGRRKKALSEKARSIVSDGIAQGLGRGDISQNLREAFQTTTIKRNAFYWDVVASAFVNRARTFSEMSSFTEAGITHYVITAVMDERTSDVCRFMDGKRFSVSTAVEQFQRVEQLRDPEQMKLLQPWLQIRQDSQGNRALFIPTESESVRAAIVEDSAELKGLKDNRGTFRSEMSNQKLESMNMSLPPFHGLCRTTVLPEV